MTEETKEHLSLIMGLLQSALKETNTYIGIVMNKADVNKSEIVFLDREEYAKGKKDGVTVKLERLNGFEEEQDDKCR